MRTQIDGLNRRLSRNDTLLGVISSPTLALAHI
jgi:hypothetical protein